MTQPDPAIGAFNDLWVHSMAGIKLHAKPESVCLGISVENQDRACGWDRVRIRTMGDRPVRISANQTFNRFGSLVNSGCSSRQQSTRHHGVDPA